MWRSSTLRLQTVCVVSDADFPRRFTETPYKIIDMFGRENVFVEIQRISFEVKNVSIVN